MNLPFFIARRTALSSGQHFSKVILRIGIAAVALSVAVMIASTALISGFKHEISRKIFEFWGHLHITNANNSFSFEPTPIDKTQPFYPSIDTIRGITYTLPSTFLGFETGGETELPSHGGIRHIQVFAHKPGIIKTKTAIEGILLKGVGSDFDWNNLMPYLLEGRPFATNDSSPSREIIVSKQTADRLNLKLGDKFIAHFVKDNEQLRRVFSICGIYKTGLEEYDRKFAICDLRQVQDLLGWAPDQVAGFEVWLDDLRDLELYNTYVYQEIMPAELLSVSIREKFPAIFEWLELQDYNEVVILGLMLAVAIINMITALLVLVLERTNMIGVLKALGETNGRIRQIFLYHAAVITLMGMFWGNFIGLGFCWLQDKFRFIRLNEADYYLAYAPVKLNWWAVAGVNIGTLVVTLVFLLIPSLVVSNISPVKAIRFK